MRKKLALVNIAVALAVVASFMALSGGSVAAKVVNHGKITVTVAGWASTPAEPADLQKVINSFEKANPKYNVKLEEYNGNAYPTTILASISSGGGPDVFYVNSDKFLGWQEAKALYPLTSFIKKDPSYDYTDMYKGLRAGFTVGGKVYGIDKDYSTLGLFINTSIWNAAHMGKVPTTWSAFAKDACAISNYEHSHGQPNVDGAGLAADQARWNPLLQSLGGSVLNKAQNKPAINSKAGVSAINDWAGLVKQHCAAWPTSTQGGWSGGEFGPGDAAMVWEGPWLIPYLQSTYPNVHYKIVPLPVHGNYTYTVAYSMNPHSSNKAAAWKVLSYLTGKVGEKQWVNLFKVLPARSSIKAPAGDGAFLKGSKYAESYLFKPGYTDPGGPYATLNTDIMNVGNGTMTAKAAVVDVTGAINHWLHA